MPSRHVLRVASRMKFIISQVLQRELKDPRMGFVTILDVEPTEDFKEAKVRFSVLGGPGTRSRSLHALQDASGFIQRRIAKNLRLRNTPVLRFILADPDDASSRLEALIRRARDLDDASGAGEDAATEPDEIADTDAQQANGGPGEDGESEEPEGPPPHA